MGDSTTWAVAFLVAALLLCFLEVFVPSLGILTLSGLACAITSVVFGFQAGGGSGTVFLILNITGLPFAFAMAFKLLPHSPLAHKGASVEKSTYQPIQSLDGLDGASGVAFTDLRPGGTAIINDKKVDVVAKGGYIDEGMKVKVLSIEGTKVVVEKETV